MSGCVLSVDYSCVQMKISAPFRQRGVFTVLIAIALLALVAVAGFALDMGHVFLSKGRLQNVVDAAALAAAKTLDDTGNLVSATTSAVNVFKTNAEAQGHKELKNAYDSGAITLAVDYSASLVSFPIGSTEGPYVRVTASGYTVSNWLIRVAGLLQTTLSASAVAGPQPLGSDATVCNVAPVMVCASPGSTATNHWGYTLNDPVVLKNSDTNCGTDTGKGNFQLLSLGSSGADAVRENLAGGYAQCITGGSTVETEPGNNVGAIAQGLNTRFGKYKGSVSSSTYPPDVIIDEQPKPGLVAQCIDNSLKVKLGSTVITHDNIDQLYNFAKYTADLADPSTYDYQPRSSGGVGAYNRRTVAVPVGDCSGTSGGRGTVPVRGYLCFWLLQSVGEGGKNSYIFGQFTNDCSVNGVPGSDPGDGDGPHIIQLFKSPGSVDS